MHTHACRNGKTFLSDVLDRLLAVESVTSAGCPGASMNAGDEQVRAGEREMNGQRFVESATDLSFDPTMISFHGAIPAPAVEGPPSSKPKSGFLAIRRALTN